MNNVAVALSNVGKIYNNVTVVDNLSLSIEGEIFGLLRTNGAGKSTTIRLAIALAQPNRGTIEVAGYEVAHHHLIKKTLVWCCNRLVLMGNYPFGKILNFMAECTISLTPKENRE